MDFRPATIFFFLFISIQISAQAAIDDEAVNWLQAFLQVDTINPPGNESRAVDFYASIFEKEGIEYSAAESAPGRGNIWARIKGGDSPALILLQHTDVVPANMKFWTAEPLSGEKRDGFIWGRGALDMKGTGISHLATFLSLHRSGIALNRDVVFLDTSSEFKFLTKSTIETKESITWEDGKDYPLVKVEVSSASHPFYTGKKMLLDTAGRVEKFNKRYKKN